MSTGHCNTLFYSILIYSIVLMAELVHSVRGGDLMSVHHDSEDEDVPPMDRHCSLHSPYASPSHWRIQPTHLPRQLLLLPQPRANPIPHNPGIAQFMRPIFQFGTIPFVHNLEAADRARNLPALRQQERRLSMPQIRRAQSMWHG
mmetsp:Transcript_20380/g.56715  ORF Transcript_20380/g.56715 Transcript_20380/m.56715 type:complete len:145 (+) Transcript_20380:1258-1692(+)